ncbi:MAG: ATP-dependent DNA ligase [bacterium]|nr:ATP-dependent DNA ligase [bacterium]
MRLPIEPPYLPMEASETERLPFGAQWVYEPKWDGFRCLAFRDRTEIALQSKAGQPLTRYFPEIVEQLRRLQVARFVLDGEVMVEVHGRLSYDALAQRIHPARSRAHALARESPARYVVFDLLVDEDIGDCTALALDERRMRLERFMRRHASASPLLLSPQSRSRAEAMEWFARTRDALDGIVAKRADLPYASGTRAAAVKLKRMRTADCVVGGYRLNAERNGIGALLLGLYDAAGRLHYVGYTSGFKTRERSPLLKRLREIEGGPGFEGVRPGDVRYLGEPLVEEAWFPVAPRLIVEVHYHHLAGDRFRDGAKLVRWRPDKSPRQCTFEQFASAVAGSPLDMFSTFSS